MARNKYPEETIQKIIDVSARLFLEQGYEQTSIQDIINHLGGLSKGAIYHHFHSKEEILDAVMNHLYADHERQVYQLCVDSSLNGLEKLRALLNSCINNAAQLQTFSFSVDLLRNPHLLTSQLRTTIEEVAHQIVLPIVLAGIEDGSLRGLQYPREFSESFMLLANIWLNPMIYPVTPDEVEQKCRFLQHLLRSLGIEDELLGECVIEGLRKYTELYHQKRNA